MTHGHLVSEGPYIPLREFAERVAQRLGLTSPWPADRITYALRRGTLPGVKVGGRWYPLESALEDYVKHNQGEGS